VSSPIPPCPRPGRGNNPAWAGLTILCPSGLLLAFVLHLLGSGAYLFLGLVHWEGAYFVLAGCYLAMALLLGFKWWKRRSVRRHTRRKR
jgi:hypothetical protein